ncbi:MAG: ABC transporter permease [Armatimonadetes bacterium]|nr:ABC transporter permease [Armatimonadota bacterium]
MTAYFLRRLALVPLTFLVITFLVYAILRVVPGGPIEQAEAALRIGALTGEASGGGLESDLQLDEEALRELERYYQLDKPIPVGYLQWLGAWPRKVRTRVPASTREAYEEEFKPLLELQERAEALRQELAGSQGDQVVYKDRLYRPLTEEEKKERADLLKGADELVKAGFGKRDELLVLLEPHALTYQAETYSTLVEKPEPETRRLVEGLQAAREKSQEIASVYGFEVDPSGSIYKLDRRFSGILQLDFGRSYTHSEPVLPLILSRMQISVIFGLAGYLVTWLICVPLGVLKAVRHRGFLDTATSLLVFIGYSMPGFVVCMLLLTSVAAKGWLPLGGAGPDNIDQLPFWQAFLERLRYMVIPVTGYLVGMFATMTVLTKNSLLENLSSDYVRTAFAKGMPEGRVLFVHALRNSLIPLTAGIGHAIGLLFAGSFLIEKACNIDGMGLLGVNSLLQRDYPVVLGILVFGVLITLIGNILSDLIWAAIDPRIRFEGGA